MRIFLIGMPGSGKSTVGKELAMALSWPFVDLDEEIVKSRGKAITSIFEQEGEDAFRIYEKEALHRLCAHTPRAVIATGGGTPCFYDNLACIHKHGVSIFLEMPIKELVKRMEQSEVSKRPLLAGSISIENKMTQKYAVRKAFYKQAEMKVDAARPVDEIVSELLEKIKARG